MASQGDDKTICIFDQHFVEPKEVSSNEVSQITAQAIDEIQDKISKKRKIPANSIIIVKKKKKKTKKKF